MSQSREVASIRTTAPVIRVHLASNRLALVTDRFVALYTHQPKIEKSNTFETTQNPLGLCCLGEKYLVIPGRSAGHLQVIDLQSKAASIIPAHSSTLRAMTLSHNERLIASCSDKGTLVRIHSTSTTARLAELRRGVTPATILSLAFSPNDSQIASTSDTNTLHIFDLPPLSRPSSAVLSSISASSRSPTPEPNPPPSNKWGPLAKLPFAPRVFTDVYSSTSAVFDPGTERPDEEMVQIGGADSKGFVKIMPGVPGGKPTKGVASWIDANTIAVVSAGRQARYERFVLQHTKDAKLVCVRDGWVNYLQQIS